MSDAVTAHTHCRNCNLPLTFDTAKFCANCGQTTHMKVPSVREFVHEFFNHYVSVEGKLWRTLKALLFQPGLLAVEHLAGRRERYVGPLKLFLTFSLLFFIAFKFAVSTNYVAPTPATKPTNIAKHTTPSAGSLSTPDHHAKTVEQNIDGAVAAMKQHGLLLAMLLLPFFAVLTRVLFPQGALNYGTHLLFALHAYSAFFLLAALLLGVSVQWAVATGFGVGGAYLFFAARRLFKTGLIRTFFGVLILIVLYSLFATLAVLLAGQVAVALL